MGSSSASTFVGYRWVSPSVTHMSCSCRLSRVAYGCDGQSVRRSLKTGSMYRRTGSARKALVYASPAAGTGPVVAGTIVLSICGGSSIDIVARSAWSRSRSA